MGKEIRGKKGVDETRRKGEREELGAESCSDLGTIRPSRLKCDARILRVRRTTASCLSARDLRRISANNHRFAPIAWPRSSGLWLCGGGRLVSSGAWHPSPHQSRSLRPETLECKWGPTFEPGPGTVLVPAANCRFILSKHPPSNRSCGLSFSPLAPFRHHPLLEFDGFQVFYEECCWDRCGTMPVLSASDKCAPQLARAPHVSLG